LVWPRLREASCWRTWRRDFPRLSGHRPISEIARRPLDRVPANSYDVGEGRDISGQPADVRYAGTQKFSLPKVLRRSLLGPEATASWAFPGKKQFGQAFRLWPQTSGSLQLVPGQTVAWPSDNNQLNAPCEPIGKSKKETGCFAGADTAVQINTRPRP